jgi:ATP-dependent RNA helicase DDX3X
MGKWKKLCKPRPNPLRYDPARDKIRAEPLILIIAPTRELAAQIYDETRRLSYRSMLRPCVLYGGAPTKLQMEELGKGCDILIGTPGRIIDAMNRSNVLGMNRVK